MIKNKRLNALINETKEIDKLLDIGCDHGLVLKGAFDQAFIKEGIAADINAKPLESAKKNLDGYNVKYVVSDGFKAINEEFDGVVIAGMGAMLITKIMEHAPDEKDITYILQPNGKYEVLRSFLTKNGFKIIDETIVKDKFYYIIIKSIRGFSDLTDEQIFLGPILMNKDSSKNYYRYVLDKYYQLMNLKGVEDKTILERVKWLENIIE
ncbi:MAG: class I SAM-dependent methyltransferase [Acholeplasma sp.]|nr:class I SAM-dependent methyltransferase [Acholeplasma sp.]